MPNTPIILPIRRPEASRTLAVEVPGPGRLVIEVPSDPEAPSRAWFTPASALLPPSACSLPPEPRRSRTDVLAP